MRISVLLLILGIPHVFAADANSESRIAEIKLLKAQLQETVLRLELERHPAIVQAHAAVLAAQQEFDTAAKAAADSAKHPDGQSKRPTDPK